MHMVFSKALYFVTLVKRRMIIFPTAVDFYFVQFVNYLNVGQGAKIRPGSVLAKPNTPRYGIQLLLRRLLKCSSWPVIGNHSIKLVPIRLKSDVTSMCAY